MLGRTETRQLKSVERDTLETGPDLDRKFDTTAYSGAARELVARRAYELWEERGRPFGSPEADWFEALREFRERFPEGLEDDSVPPFSDLSMEPVET